MTAKLPLAFGLLALLLATSSADRCAAQENTFRMPNYPDMAPPPPRTQAEVDRLLAGGDADAGETDRENADPLHIVLVDGPKDHGKGEHDYPAWKEVWSRLLAEAEYTTVDTAREFPSADQIEAADVLVFYQRGSWNDERAAAVDPFLARGGGLVYIHWAVDGRGQEAEMARRIGLSALGGGGIKYRHGELNVDFSPGADHPIARNLDRVRWVDESYWKLTGDPEKISLLGTQMEDGQPWPQFWTVERGRGRVFVSIPGHYMWSFDDPVFRAVLLRGIAWAGHRDVDRFNKLVTLDARVE